MVKQNPMNDWKQLYQRRRMTPEDALRRIPPHSRVVTSHAAAEPRIVLNVMADHPEWFEDVEVFSVLLMGEVPYCAPRLFGHVRYNTMFVSGGTREGVNRGYADFTTTFYSELPSLLGGLMPVDVALLSVSPPDEHGYCSFGLTVDYQRAAVNAAKLVIAQVNDQMPRTMGESFIHVNEIDCVVEASQPLPELPRPTIGEVEMAIGEHCASLVRDGDTIQVGIGAIPDAVLMSLKGKKDLGVHTEMFSDGVIELIEMGVVTNRRKTLNRGRSVATFLMGTGKLYDYVNDNPAVMLMPVDYTNSPWVISRHDNMVAINSCIQVDLSGQVGAETLGRTQFSGTGGQVDFVRGANMSKGGRAIIAMPSTAANGGVSRIVPYLDSGTAVTTCRNDVNYIVTEYGVAQLKGKTLRQRAEALIAIAHPDFRKEMISALKERYP